MFVCTEDTGLGENVLLLYIPLTENIVISVWQMALTLKLPWGIKFELLIFFPLVQKSFIWNLQSSSICRDKKLVPDMFGDGILLDDLVFFCGMIL